MSNLLLYIQALRCNSIVQLLQHVKVENDTAYVLNNDYKEATHATDDMSIIDAIIHNTSNCQYFEFLGHKITYKWNDEIKQYIYSKNYEPHESLHHNR